MESQATDWNTYHEMEAEGKVHHQQVQRERMCNLQNPSDACEVARLDDAVPWNEFGTPEAQHLQP